MDQEHSTPSIDTKLAVIQTDMSYIKQTVVDIKKEVETGYVTQSDFTPVKNLVYGMVGLILSGVVIAIMALVLRSK